MDEQRAANTITRIEEPQRLTGDALRQQIEALQAQYELEQDAARKAEDESNPPRPHQEVLVDLLTAIAHHIGNPHPVMGLMKELLRTVAK